MAGSSYGNIFRITTWGESHGRGIGVVVDGCPAGLVLDEGDIQTYLDRRKPGQSRYTTKRQESDTVEILSGVFEGKTTGTPISLAVWNTDQRSRDYGNLTNCYRPGHADYPFDCKYGIRDYRGGGRSSGRETIGRVAGGAIAAKILREMGINVYAYSKSIGPVSVDATWFDRAVRDENPLYMPDASAAEAAQAYLDECMQQCNSAGGVIECLVEGVPVGIGDPVFEKLDANLAKAMLSIGAVKGFEMGDGFAVAGSTGKDNNDAFRSRTVKMASDVSDGAVDTEEANKKSHNAVYKVTNHSGGTLGGMSDGSDLVFRVAVKPTPSIATPQDTVNSDGEEVSLTIHGRHDPVIVPRAVVVVESMAAITVLDALLMNMTSRMDGIVSFYGRV